MEQNKREKEVEYCPICDEEFDDLYDHICDRCDNYKCDCDCD